MIWVILACIASSALYRCGGKGKPFNTRYRDIGCSLVLIALTMALFGIKEAFWAYILTFGLSWGALASYWGQDEKKFGYFWHGLGCGLAGIPLIWVGVPLWVILTRLVICTVGMAVWSEIIGNDVMEEAGRGVIFII